MLYLERRPGRPLFPAVRVLWTFDSGTYEPSAEPTRIVPDGCVELILHLGTPYAETVGDALTAQPRALVTGQITGPLVLVPQGAALVVGVRLAPWAAGPLLGLPMHELADAHAEAVEVFGEGARQLLERAAGAQSPESRLTAVERGLQTLLAAGREAANPIAFAVDAIERSEGRVSLDRLTALTGLSARTLERRFLATVGVSPRLFASIRRFRGVFDRIERGEAPGGGTAVASGYFDQAHMLRDFRRFAGQPPREFFPARGGLSAALVGHA